MFVVSGREGSKISNVSTQCSLARPGRYNMNRMSTSKSFKEFVTDTVRWFALSTSLIHVTHESISVEPEL